MERHRARNLAGLSGSLSAAVGVAVVALFSQANGACSTNVIVLADAQITKRSCAAYSVLCHLGLGLVVLGVVLIIGAFILSLGTREQPAPGDVSVGDLPPGWFGDPTNRDKPVQWWDGHALVDRPPPRAEAGHPTPPD